MGAGSVPVMVDVTDATFETAVIERSDGGPGRRRPVGAVVRPVPHARARSWRRWSRRPATGVELVKVNIDENPQVAAAFRVQSIPAVFARQGPGGRGRVHRRAARGPGRASSSPGWRRPRARPTSWSPRATRRRCARRSSSSPTTAGADRGTGRAARRQGRRGVHRGGAPLLARIPETPETRRVARPGPPAATGRSPTGVDDKLDDAADRGQERRRGPARSTSTCSTSWAPGYLAPPQYRRTLSAPPCSDRATTASCTARRPSVAV